MTKSVVQKSETLLTEINTFCKVRDILRLLKQEGNKRQGTCNCIHSPKEYLRLHRAFLF